jgi:glycosyltransferase involved in cell wall biosynthesis
MIERIQRWLYEQREGVVTKLLSVMTLLKRVVPMTVRQPLRGVVLSLLIRAPLRQQLRRTWRRRNRLKRRVRRGRYRIKLRVRRMRNRLKRLQRKHLKSIWLHAQLLVRLPIWRMRRRKRLVETSKEIHLINPLKNVAGGADMRTLHLYDELKDHADVHLWSGHEVAPEIAEKYPVKRIDPERFEFPKTGTFVFVGARPATRIGPWIHYTDPSRTILVHNSDIAPWKFRNRLQHISKGGRREVEVLYASEQTKRKAGNYPGFVQASLIDLDRFVPAPTKKPSDSASASFTVGRLSRDAPFKHHPDDPVLYRRLVEEGCRIRIMGPSPSLEEELGGLQSVTLLPAYAQEAPLFLQGLDCFFYRTSEEFVEPSGRVVTEAMACGLPVVCHNRGGYTETIDHGHNGFLFETQQEALEILLLLKEDPALRERVGREARRTAEELFSDVVRSEIVEFYLR